MWWGLGSVQKAAIKLSGDGTTGRPLWKEHGRVDVGQTQVFRLLAVIAQDKTQCERKMNSHMICDGNGSPYLGLKLMQ
eukprot:scaffold4007_cov49-Cyclotella_meneghiniana.AAC.8